MPFLIYFLSATYLKEVCKDSDNGKVDTIRRGCSDYNEIPKRCGRYDDFEFSANSMCCACKGKYLTNCFRKYGQSESNNVNNYLMHHLFKCNKTWILSFKASCICEFSNGGIGRNGIMCNHYGDFQNFFSCSNEELCTGPTRREKVVKSTDVHLLLCSGKL